MPYREADLSRVSTVPVAERRNQVDASLLATPPDRDRSISNGLSSLPHVLAAKDLRAVIDGVAAAARADRGVVLLIGGHVMLEDPVVVQGTRALHLRYPVRR